MKSFASRVYVAFAILATLSLFQNCGELKSHDSVSAGGTAGPTRSLGTLSITPAAAQLSANEVDTNINEAFALLLNRKPDAAGLSTYRTKLSTDKIPISEVLLEIASTPEFKALAPANSRSGTITRLYQRLLARNPNDGELAYWNGLSLNDANTVRTFFATPEVRERHPNLVQEVSRCRFGTSPSPADAAPMLNACINLATRLALLPAGVYEIGSHLVLGQRNQLTIATEGFEAELNAPACLDSAGDQRCAILKAHPDFMDGPLLTAKATAAAPSVGLAFRYVSIDGNIGARRGAPSNGPASAKNAKDKIWNDYSLGTNRIKQANVSVSFCNSCSFVGISSIYAVGATAFEFNGDDVIFDRSTFRDTGYGLNYSPQFGEWGDGLTAISMPRGRVLRSKFWNNSDINLIVSNIQNAIISDNVIGADSNFAFAGLMLDSFKNNAHTNHQNGLVTNNSIDCGAQSLCGIGLEVGPYAWYTRQDNPVEALRPIEGGRVEKNKIMRAKQGIGIHGAKNYTFANNVLTQAGGFDAGQGRVTSLIDMTGNENIIGLENLSVPYTANRIIASLNLAADPDFTAYLNPLAAAASVSYSRDPASAEKLITGVYNRYLTRGVGLSEMRYHLDRMFNQSIGATEVFLSIQDSAEAKDRDAKIGLTQLQREQRDVAQSVDLMQFFYQTCLNRSASGSEIEYWMSTGMSRQSIQASVCKSAEAAIFFRQ